LIETITLEWKRLGESCENIDKFVKEVFKMSVLGCIILNVISVSASALNQETYTLSSLGEYFVSFGGLDAYMISQ
jgi:hypothetical protein